MADTAPAQSTPATSNPAPTAATATSTTPTPAAPAATSPAAASPAAPVEEQVQGQAEIEIDAVAAAAVVSPLTGSSSQCFTFTLDSLLFFTVCSPSFACHNSPAAKKCNANATHDGGGDQQAPCIGESHPTPSESRQLSGTCPPFYSFGCTFSRCLFSKDISPNQAEGQA